jgi:8-oxo-dGTP diphosphatase
MYQYEYPHPAVSTDVVAFSVMDQNLRVLLICRNEEPYGACLALPGGFVRIDEALEDAAYRVLNEKTPLKQVYIEQLQTFGEVQRDPRERVISVVYIAIVPAYLIVDNRELWHSVSDLSTLAFDHSSIVKLAQQRLRSKLQYSSIAFRFLPPTFTLTEAQHIYEVILSDVLEKRNFRKQLLTRGILKSTGEISQGGAHRPAQLYTLLHDDALQYW